MAEVRLDILGIIVQIVALPLTFTMGFFGQAIFFGGVVVFWIGWLERHERSSVAPVERPPPGIIPDYDSNELPVRPDAHPCPFCGAAVSRSAAKFCSQCGKPLTPLT